MSNEIKIIRNVRKPSIYDPDLTQKVIEEERRRLELEKKSGKKAVTKENNAADKIPDVTDLAVSYNDIQFKARAYRKKDNNEKELFYFNDGEFLSEAVERKGNSLICYLDPEGLVWNANKYVKKSFKFARKLEFNIAGKDSLKWIDLKEFDDKFVEWHYTRKFSELPKIMQKGNNRVQIYLPPDCSIWPVGRGSYGSGFDIDGYCYGSRASRGVRKKIP